MHATLSAAVTDCHILRSLVGRLLQAILLEHFLEFLGGRLGEIDHPLLVVIGVPLILQLIVVLSGMGLAAYAAFV